MANKKLMPNEKWLKASKYARQKFGTTLNELIEERDRGSKEAQKKINEAIYAAGDYDTREKRAESMISTVIDDYNKMIEKKERAKMKAINERLDLINEAVIDVNDVAIMAKIGLESIPSKKKKKEMAGE